MSGATNDLVIIQHNLENGGLSAPTPGRLWDRDRLDAWIGFIRHQKAEHGVNVILQQEGCFYHAEGHMLLHEIEAATGLRGFLARGLRAQSAGGKDHPVIVWIDPHQITPVRHFAHSGGTWWHGAMQVEALVGEHTISLVSAHLNVASPVLRQGEGAALSMIGGLLVIGVDANSARATGTAQSMSMSDRKHHAHRAASPDRPDKADRAFAQYAEFSGLVEVHTHVGTPDALRFTTGHRPKQERQGGGSHADHAYLSPALADGTAGKITGCVVITEREYPGIDTISDHLPTRFRLSLTRTPDAS